MYKLFLHKYKVIISYQIPRKRKNRRMEMERMQLKGKIRERIMKLQKINKPKPPQRCQLLLVVILMKIVIREVFLSKMCILAQTKKKLNNFLQKVIVRSTQ